MNVQLEIGMDWHHECAIGDWKGLLVHELVIGDWKGLGVHGCAVGDWKDCWWFMNS